MRDDLAPGCRDHAHIGSPLWGAGDPTFVRSGACFGRTCRCTSLIAFMSPGRANTSVTLYHLASRSCAPAERLRVGVEADETVFGGLEPSPRGCGQLGVLTVKGPLQHPSQRRAAAGAPVRELRQAAQADVIDLGRSQ